jgi:hypothetical protein
MSLARIADAWSIADIAVLSGLAESTVSRLWDDPRWLDRISGKSLQGLVSAIPRIDEYVRAYSLADRRAKLVEDLAQRGVHVDLESFKVLVQEHGVPEQYLSNALSAAIPVLDRDADLAASWLVRFWGREQDAALGYAFGTETGRPGLLCDPAPLLSAAVELVHLLGDKANSFHAIVGQANLSHHIARAADSPNTAELMPAGRQSALAARSVVMGKLIANNDLDVAQEYCTSLERKDFLAVIEEWAFPTYTHDASVTRDFSIPRGLILRRTATEVLREIPTYNDAYLFYLAKTCVPTILDRDQTFGGCLNALTTALRQRVEVCTERASRVAVTGLLGNLEQRTSSKIEESPFGYEW